jgi:hypothetical protein
MCEDKGSAQNDDSQEKQDGSPEGQRDVLPPEQQEEESLREGVRRIVTSRERTPRDPRWQRAWWETLLRYNRRLTRLRQERHDARGKDES